MEILNGTSTDGKAYVHDGSSAPPMDPHRRPNIRAEETAHWPMLRAGSRLSYDLKSEGPWDVYFFVQGKAYSVTAHAGSHLTLLQNGGGFTVQVD